MTHSQNPAKLSRDERLAEVARILARGILRLRERESDAPKHAKPPDEKARKSPV